MKTTLFKLWRGLRWAFLTCFGLLLIAGWCAFAWCACCIAALRGKPNPFYETETGDEIA